MWCKHCRQDVPGLATASSGQRACARCGAVLIEPAAAVHAHGLHGLAANGVDLGEHKRHATKAPPAIDEWELERDMRDLEGLLSGAPAGSAAAHAAGMLGGSDVRNSQVPATAFVPAPTARRDLRLRSPVWSWLAFALGVAALACGSALLGASYALERGDLWTYGLPPMVAGQVLLIVALALQLERVWQGSRYALEKLTEVDDRLADLKQTTTLLGVTHGSAAQAFYAHMAEGASPQLLLADLKGQLDLLAVRMSRQR